MRKQFKKLIPKGPSTLHTNILALKQVRDARWAKTLNGKQIVGNKNSFVSQGPGPAIWPNGIPGPRWPPARLYVCLFHVRTCTNTRVLIIVKAYLLVSTNKIAITHRCDIPVRSRGCIARDGYIDFELSRVRYRFLLFEVWNGDIFQSFVNVLCLLVSNFMKNVI